MKTFLKMSVVLAAFLSGIVTQSAEARSPAKLVLDTQKSVLKWSGKFMSTDIDAQMKFKSGLFQIKGNTIQSGAIVADMTTLTSDSGMDAQLKGPLFLNVAQFPTAELKIKEFTELKAFAPGGPNARIKGTLTFHGQTHPVQGEFILTPDKAGFHVTGTFPTVYGKMLQGAVTYEIWAKK